VTEHPDPGVREIWLGRLQIILAALLWSTSGFFAKAPLFADWSGPVLAFWRALFASLLLVPQVRRPRWTWGLIPLMVAFAAMNFTYLTAMVECEATLAIWLQNTAPAWVFLVSVFLLREHVHQRDKILLMLAMAGVGLILNFELRGSSPSGVIFGLLAGATYACVVVMIRQLRDHDPFWLIALSMVGTAIVLLPWGWSSGRWPEGHQWWYLAAFGMLQMATPYVLFARGLKVVPGHEAAGIALLEPLLVPVWVFLAWRHHPTYESPAWWTILGGTLILAGLVIRLWTPRQTGRRSRRTTEV
jgi:drug/metabolite transporter, DME family